MEVSQIFKQKKAVYSFEIFPPKPTSTVESIERVLDGIACLNPDYVSITCGAGGSEVMGNATFNLAKRLKNEYGILPLVHVTAIHSEKEDIIAYLVMNIFILFLQKNCIQEEYWMLQQQ